MPPPSFPGGWTDTADKQLLLSILATRGVGSIDWSQVAAVMNNGVTVQAASRRYGIIRKSVTANGDDDNAAPKTPAKRGNSSKETSSTRKRKTGKDTSADEGAEDDDEHTPAKEVSKKEFVKQEASEDYGSDGQF